MPGRVSRHGRLLAVLVVLGGALTAGCTVNVRKEIHSLTPDQIDALRKGVALMQSRSETDPTSWLYQANIHGVPSAGSNCTPSAAPPQPAWATCQHGSFFFLAWHRMYLYYFERILRAAVREAVGNPNYDFSLPFWDYENPGFSDLPAPLRVPGDNTNPLFVAERAAGCNAGIQCVSPTQAADSVALGLIPFCNCDGTPCGCDTGLLPDQTFGGQFIPAPEHFAGLYGELESQPHNVVHVAVGGPSGWMTDPDCAARDPVFWLHHANIDRLWQVWLNQGGRQNPLGSDEWKTQTFTFVTETKQQVTLTACQILDMCSQLGYKYDGVPVKNVPLCPTGSAAVAQLAAAGAPPPRVRRVLAASEAAESTLGSAPVTLSVALPPEAAQRLFAVGSGKESGHPRLVIEGLKLLHPGALYEVYLNLPEGQKPDPSGPYFVGHIALFGPVGEHAGESSRSFDLSDRLHALTKRGESVAATLRVTLVRGNPPQRPAAAKESEAFVRFTRVSIVER